MTPLDTVDCHLIPTPPAGAGPSALAERFRRLRETTRRLVAPLSAEDMTPQSMPDASPVKWHLAHTTWFFETFLLLPQGVRPFDPAFQYLFNSYYEALGERQPRPARGQITRPGVAEVMAYRDHVDAAVGDRLRGHLDDETEALVQLGFAHEEQHQELLLMDVLHLFAQNRLKPAYTNLRKAAPSSSPSPCTFTDLPGGVVEIGHQGTGFAFDSEGPRHEVLLRPCRLADRLVTNAEWLSFMEDGGYARPEFWLSDGWACRQAEGWEAPLYWERDTALDHWRSFGLHGLQALDPIAPVAHVSFYEADAFARWSGARLPLEAEWERAARSAGAPGAFLDDGDLAPRPARAGPLAQMFGDLWEWTASPYVAYPGFRPATGAVGEYNGKFMINQMVLRGGACVSPADHVRASYRNFFQPHQRWQFSGVRLAMD